MTTTAHTTAPAATSPTAAITITTHEHGHVLEARTSDGRLYGRAWRSSGHNDDEVIGWGVETIDGITVVPTRPAALGELQDRAAHATGPLGGAR